MKRPIIGTNATLMLRDKDLFSSTLRVAPFYWILIWGKKTLPCSLFDENIKRG